MTASYDESNPQEQQNPHALPLWLERMITVAFATPLFFLAHADVNFRNCVEAQPVCGGNTELVRTDLQKDR
ncbi:MAG: hypothetical protein FJX22_03675 [Alphaproteobacteria bacterium]|nr:hypothetical protein [Alphaproteobacteria bacterium]